MISTDSNHAGGKAFDANAGSIAVPNPSADLDPFGTIAADCPAGPRRIGSYRIVCSIAAGSMGQVFRAVNEATGEAVALKLVRQSCSARQSEKDRAFFLREMSVLSRLDHPRIVTIRDFGSVDGQLFMAMEYIKTFDLRRQLMQCSASQ